MLQVWKQWTTMVGLCMKHTTPRPREPRDTSRAPCTQFHCNRRSMPHARLGLRGKLYRRDGGVMMMSLGAGHKRHSVHSTTPSPPPMPPHTTHSRYDNHAHSHNATTPHRHNTTTTPPQRRSAVSPAVQPAFP